MITASAGPVLEARVYSVPLRTRFQRDISELEEYFDTFARRHPELTCCMLRFQPEIGAGLASPLVRYLTLPVVPVQLGFDPRLQLLDAEDATAAIVAAATNLQVPVIEFDDYAGDILHAVAAAYAYATTTLGFPR